ncbi:MAG: hypothetical protein ACRCTS_07175 [Fusobacteriaceae bacterium]
MNKGGKRPNSGRKKIEGKQIKLLLESNMLEAIEKKFEGTTQTDKIRKCILKGLEKA